MTTIFMKANTKGLDPQVINSADDKGLVQAVVPFGGSAISVTNPNKQILGGKGLGL
jgi:hypothetical protein